MVLRTEANIVVPPLNMFYEPPGRCKSISPSPYREALCDSAQIVVFTLLINGVRSPINIMDVRFERRRRTPLIPHLAGCGAPPKIHANRITSANLLRHLQRKIHGEPRDHSLRMRQRVRAQLYVLVQHCVEIGGESGQHAIHIGGELQLSIAIVIDLVTFVRMIEHEHGLRFANVERIFDIHHVWALGLRVIEVLLGAVRVGPMMNGFAQRGQQFR